MPFLDRLNQKFDKWNSKLEQINVRLEQQRQQQLQQQQQQPPWSTSSQPPPAYPGPPPPLPPRPNNTQSPSGPIASTSVTGVDTTNAWQTPPPPPPATNPNWQSPPTDSWQPQPQQASPPSNAFQTPPPPSAPIPPPPVPQFTPFPTQAAGTTGPSGPIPSISNISLTITSDSSGELEPLPVLQEIIDAHKAAEAAVPPTVTAEYQSHLKSLLDAVSNTREASSAKTEAARSAQYSQEVFSGGTDAWFRLCYNPAAEAMRAGLQDMERNYWEIARSKRDGMGEEDVHEWAKAMEMAFNGCERLRMEWDNLEREKREQESTGKSTWLYNNRHDDGVYEAVREVERAKNHQDKIVQAELSSATYARTAQYVNEIIGPFLRSFISACATRRTPIGNVISAVCPLLPTPPDPKDVDRVPPLTPRATEALVRQLRDTANAFDTLTYRIQSIHERLDSLDRKLQESSHQAELDALLLKHYGPNDTWGNQSAWDARNARQNAQSNESIALMTSQSAARDARRDETQAVVRPCWDRVVKWERDRRNDLMAKAAAGPGGAAFLSNMMTMQHASAMGTNRLQVPGKVLKRQAL
ncbi:hypothetical protein FRC05_008013 [Tulasnella sp. 425]|nr:hypothetical protein FRC05_008013 [Tulasnella sp. 425]